MKAFEFSGPAPDDGMLPLPPPLLESMRAGNVVRIMLLVHEHGDPTELDLWQQLAAQLLAQPVERAEPPETPSQP